MRPHASSSLFVSLTPPTLSQGGEGAACPLMAPYPLARLLGYLTRKEVPSVPDPCQQAGA